jgi:hypothetical protein
MIMKWICYCVVVFVSFSCEYPDKGILLGNWKVKSGFYKAGYQIVQQNDQLKCIVNYYDDGTTVFNRNQKPAQFVFHDLKWKKDAYVDVSSGASKLNQSMKLKFKSRDTLEVTSYVMQQALKEIWVRDKLTKTQ